MEKIFGGTENKEHPKSKSEKLNELLGQFVASGPDGRKEIGPEIYNFIESAFQEIGIKLGSDTQKIYQEMATMSEKNLLLRMELPQAVVEMLLEDNPKNFEKGRSGSVPRANAAAYGKEGEGVNIAFGEGRASKYGLPILMAFDPTDLEVKKISQQYCDIKQNRSLCREVSGTLVPEKISHMVIRVPRDIFPPDKITPEEEVSEAGYIFRGASIK